MTAPDTRALRTVALAATQGTWDAVCMGSEGYRVLAPNPDSPIRRIVVAIIGHEKWETDKANSEYVGTFGPATVLDLLDRIERLEMQVELDERPCGQRAVLTRNGGPVSGAYTSGTCTEVRGHRHQHRDADGITWQESVR